MVESDVNEKYSFDYALYSDFGQKEARKLSLLSVEYLQSEVIRIFKQYKINEKDAGRLTACFGIINAKELSKRMPRR